ncbi:claudin-4-like [Corythoichthys intestinalis]|uniref:claudin-4-like n=1 Tax=Corythoichthys intestinalis TaxID=161448 RepID=UPI0025A5EF73|nr:claudin-4-like [Corythoichthys intestinalis]XP_057695390.1 claudin-4-like [Corythoichthys intestinalis]XP_057695391.1 claudin-4-like [Corythoichthys intestinalis]XP_061797863.1 claudin-4-like [Nerophis lumbriciformis]
MALEELGIVLAMLGLAGTVMICALPMWKVTAFIGTRLVVMQVFWEGLWMTCVSEYTGQMQCKLYDALLDLSPELQAARGLVCVGMVLGCLGFLVFLVGARCTKCLNHPRIKARVVVVSGLIFGLAGLAPMVAVSWTANSVIKDFYNPRVPEGLKREMGAAIYIGFIASALLLCGGGFLCASGPPSRGAIRSNAYAPAGTRADNSYGIKNYV